MNGLISPKINISLRYAFAHERAFINAPFPLLIFTPPSMRYNSFGTTGFQISQVTLGTMTWGKQNTETEGHAQMDYAVERGVNAFDTAELYAIPSTPETWGKTDTNCTGRLERSISSEFVVYNPSKKTAGRRISWKF